MNKRYLYATAISALLIFLVVFFYVNIKTLQFHAFSEGSTLDQTTPLIPGQEESMAAIQLTILPTDLNYVPIVTTSSSQVALANSPARVATSRIGLIDLSGSVASISIVVVTTGIITFFILHFLESSKPKHPIRDAIFSWLSSPLYIYISFGIVLFLLLDSFLFDNRIVNSFGKYEVLAQIGSIFAPLSLSTAMVIAAWKYFSPADPTPAPSGPVRFPVRFQDFFPIQFPARPRAPLPGLVNHHATCFINSILQPLYMTLLFRQLIEVQNNPTDPILRTLQALFQDMGQSTTVVQVLPFLNTLTHEITGVGRGQPGDSFEFMTRLIRHLVNVSTRLGDGIEDLMYFRRIIMGVRQFDFGLNLQDLNGLTDLYEAVRRTAIVNPPPILILKLGYPIPLPMPFRFNIPAALNKTTVSGEVVNYRVYALVIHTGGHFLNYIKSNIPGPHFDHWFLMDDDFVGAMTDQEMVPILQNTNAARRVDIVFYIREDQYQQLHAQNTAPDS